MKDRWHFEIGKALGFPECCINSFVSHEGMYYAFEKENIRGSSPLDGTGFVPCDDCFTKKTRNQMIREINSRRDNSFPSFPASPPPSVFQRYRTWYSTTIEDKEK